MAKYDFVYLTPSSLKKNLLEDIFSNLEKEIEKIGGKIIKKEELGRKTLAYEVSSTYEANYWVWKLELQGSKDINTLNTYLNRETAIIRYLFLREGKRR